VRTVVCDGVTRALGGCGYRLVAAIEPSAADDRYGCEEAL